MNVPQLERDHIVVQASIFFFCGLVAAAAYASTIVALVEALGWHTLPATVAGFVNGTLVSYVLNARFTFKAEMDRATFIRFWIVTVIGLGINVTVVEGAQWFGLHYGFGIFGALVLAPAFNFLAHRFWSFRGQHA